jgi:ribosomal subunit interface protein
MKVHIRAEGFELTAELEKYASSKIAQLARRVPRNLRPLAGCEAVFVRGRAQKSNTCSLTLTLGDSELHSRETTQHMYAALDIAAVHVEQELKEYMAKQRRHPLRAHLRRHFGAG